PEAFASLSHGDRGRRRRFGPATRAVPALVPLLIDARAANSTHSLPLQPAGPRQRSAAVSPHELVAVAPATDAAGRGHGEVRHAHERGFLAEAVEHLAPDYAGLLGVVIGAHAELGIAALQRRMDHVPGDQRVLARTADQHREVIDGMAGGGDELQFLAEGMI